MTALAGAAVGRGTPLAAAGPDAGLFEPPDGKYDFDTIYSRIGTNSVKWDRQIAAYGKDNIAAGMGIADMDFRCAPSITQALTERVKHENWGYLDTMRPFIETVVKWNHQRYGLDVNPDAVVMAAGVHPAIIATLKTFSPPGTKVLLLTPTYNGFYGDLREARVVAEESPLILTSGRYSIDFDDFERRISHDTHTFILCNPQNPTGNCWSREDMTRLGEICLKRRVIVLSDEIHCDFVTPGHKYTPFASLPKEIVDNSITYKAASKSFSLAAMKCAWFFSTNQDYLTRIRANLRADISTLGMIASQAAYEGGEDWLNQVVAYIDGNHTFTEKFIAANIPMIKYVKAQGTYLAWLDVTGLAERIGSRQMADEESRKRAPGAPPVTPETMVERWLVRNAKVHLNQGASYGLGGQNHMRMNIATSRKLVELALTNMANALNKT